MASEEPLGLISLNRRIDAMGGYSAYSAMQVCHAEGEASASEESEPVLPSRYQEKRD